MAGIKSFTDIPQSKKLAEFLPLESADMYWKNAVYDKYIQCFTPFVIDDYRSNVDFDYDIPCWSLAALLGVLPIIENYYAEIRCVNNRFCCCYTHKQHIGDLYWRYAGNPVDACYEMIIKLNELKML